MTELQRAQKIKSLITEALALDIGGEFIRETYQRHIKDAVTSLERREKKGWFSEV